MSKIEAGKVSLNPSDFDLHDLLAGIYLMFQFKANAKGVELRLEKSTDLPQHVRTDESKLRQILVNLVGNAVKFTAVGYICLRASATPAAGQPTDTPTAATALMLHFEVEDDTAQYPINGKGSPSSATTSKPITAQDLQAMPPEWIVQLNQAAMRVDGQDITDLIAAIPPEHTALASQLTQLVENFSFEEIVALCQQQLP